MDSHNGHIITLDGPAASGKSYIAAALKKRFQGVGIPVGSLYRCIALYSLQQAIPVEDQQIAEILPALSIELGDSSVKLNGQDVTEALKEERVSIQASRIAQLPSVRKFVLEVERSMGEKLVKAGKLVIVEGRVSGIKEFPEAEVKFFLTASVEERARRRFEQLKDQGEAISYEQVLTDIQNRDKMDRTRAIDPMVQDPEQYGYVIIDSTHFTASQTIERVISELRKRGIV